jgi:hypothetical protein
MLVSFSNSATYKGLQQCHYQQQPAAACQYFAMLQTGRQCACNTAHASAHATTLSYPCEVANVHAAAVMLRLLVFAAAALQVWLC